MVTRLASTTWPSVAADAVLIVPVGSTEQHGPHLPLATDAIVATAVAEGLAEHLGTAAVLAPTIPFGASGEHAGFPGTVSIGLEALETVLVELGRSASLWAATIVFVNGHGGNLTAVEAAVRRLRGEGRDAHWVPCAVAGGDAHAGRMETSLLLHLRPDEVRISEAVSGDRRSMTELLPELQAHGVLAVSPTGVLGDPAGASADEGQMLLERMIDAAVRRLHERRP